jgi:hypothetical protein
MTHSLPQLLRNCLAFYGTHSFSTISSDAHHFIPTLTQRNAPHAFPSHFFKDQCNILPLRLGFPSGLFRFQVSPPQSCTYFSSSSIRDSRVDHIILCDLVTRVTLTRRTNNETPSLCNHTHVMPTWHVVSEQLQM